MPDDLTAHIAEALRRCLEQCRLNREEFYRRVVRPVRPWIRPVDEAELMRMDAIIARGEAALAKVRSRPQLEREEPS